VLVAISTAATVAIVIGVLLAAIVDKHLVDAATAWIRERRPPDENDMSRVVALPRQTAQLTALFWTFATPLILIYVGSVGYRFELEVILKAVLVFGYGALVASTLGYFLVETALPPVLIHVLPADSEAWHRTIGVSPRLILAWLVVAGYPFLSLALNAIGLDARQRERMVLPWSLVFVLTAVVGFLVFTFAGRTITFPLERLRKGLRRVEQGNLEDEIELDEVGELGLLQAHFNRMIAGLRERERMRDVFGRHVGTDVARLAMDTEFGTGEQCEATALFVDIIGSTGLAQRNDPDAVVAILNRFFDTVVRVVAVEGGFVNKFQGDGALCLFGTPIAQSDHATRGLRAARTLARELAPMGDIAAAIGVSSGTVVAGTVGAADRYEFTVVGDAVNEAARLSDEAKLCPSHVLVSQRTIDSAPDESNAWTVGEAIRLRGRDAPTLTFSPVTTAS
jgi:adenylate cyclase